MLSGKNTGKRMSQRIVDLIAERLPTGLVHPGDENTKPKVLALPGFAGRGIPPEMARHFADEAGLPPNDAPKVWAEALVHLIESDGGCVIVPKTEWDDVKAQSTAPDASSPVVAVHCSCNRSEPIMSVSTGRVKVTTSGAALRKRLDEVCSCS